MPRLSAYKILLSCSFPKTARILKRSEFLRLSRTGKKIQNRHFILLYSRSFPAQLRFGITVSRKVGNAVRRNRVKRLVREHVRRVRPLMSGGWDINIIAKKDAANLSGGEVGTSLAQLLAGIQRDDKKNQ
ncbi:MAG: ribonuclease P protein component [Desulfobacterales bacterium]